MKKLFFVSFSFSMILVLSACGGKSSSHESTNDQSAGKTQSPPSVNPPPVQATPTPGPSKGGNSGTEPIVDPATPAPVEAPPVCDNSGPVGRYAGYITLGDQSLSPIELNIDINKGAAVNGSQLKASFRTGLFGGVLISTDNSFFTFNDGVFTATFASAIPGGTTLQLIGTVKCGVFVDGKLHGKTDYPVTLSRGTVSPFDKRSTFKFEVSFPNTGSKATRGIMTLGQLGGSTTSGDFSDLPTVPNLTTTFQFDDHSPITADTTMYDPLRGALELSLGSKTTFVKCQSVSLKKWVGDLDSPTSLECDVSSGAAVAQKMLATQTTKSIPISPQYYSGKWLPANKNLESFPVVADVQYLGSDGANPPQFLFPKFPNLSAKIYICNEGDFSERLPMTSIAVDQVYGRVYFRASQTPNSSSASSTTTNNIDFQAVYSFGWGGHVRSLSDCRFWGSWFGHTSFGQTHCQRKLARLR